jgi:hypothetical protein
MKATWIPRPKLWDKEAVGVWRAIKEVAREVAAEAK